MWAGLEVHEGWCAGPSGAFGGVNGEVQHKGRRRAGLMIGNAWTFQGRQRSLARYRRDSI